MMQAHSLLWHYLWLAPDVLQLGLAVCFYRLGLHKRFPVFFIYTIYEALETFGLYGLDVLPSVTPVAYWRAVWITLIVGSFIKFSVIGELLRQLLGPWPALAKTGNRLLTSAGALLIFIGAIAAARTTTDNTHWIVGGAEILQQTLYLIQCGLVLFLFLFAAHFNLRWNRITFGIALGFAVVFSEHLAGWAIIASMHLPDNSAPLTVLNMATYHVAVLIWCYYLLVPERKSTTPAVSLPENNLAIWNRELERLLQQ